MSRSSAETKEVLLSAADRIIGRDGVSALTLEAVAHEAGVSKGGLLYHFSSKDILIQAMVERLVVHSTQKMSQLLEEDHIEEGSFSRAYVRSSFDELRQDHELSNETANALIAALASNPKLLEPLRTHFAEWNEQTRKEKGDRVGLTIARLAADALMIMPAFGYGDFPPELTEQIKKRLIEMTLPKRPVKRPAR